MVNEDDVRREALALRDTTEKPSYGTPGFRVHDKLFARVHDEPGVLVLRLTALEDKQALIDHDPAKFFSTPHYDGSPAVLVRLDEIDVDELRELLVDAWTARAPARVRAAGPAPG